MLVELHPCPQPHLLIVETTVPLTYPSVTATAVQTLPWVKSRAIALLVWVSLCWNLFRGTNKPPLQRNRAQESKTHTQSARCWTNHTGPRFPQPAKSFRRASRFPNQVSPGGRSLWGSCCRLSNTHENMGCGLDRQNPYTSIKCLSH